MQKYFSLVVAFGLSAVSFASNAQGWMSEAEAYIKTLSRPIDIYTWEPRASFNSKPGEIVQAQDSRVEKLLRDYALSFENPTEPLVFEGPNGVYFATGPFVSREWGSKQKPTFGGKEWSMIRVTLPKGTRFMDGRMELKFTQGVQQFVGSRGCSATSMRELLNVKSRSDKKQCWTAYVEISKKLNVPVLAKFFLAVAPSYCKNHNSFITDFIVVDPKVMTNYAVFVPEIPNSDLVSEERTFIRDYWLLARQEVEKRCSGTAINFEDRFNMKPGETCKFYYNSPYQYELPWSLPATDLSSPALKQKIEEKIHGCGNYREDIP